MSEHFDLPTQDPNFDSKAWVNDSSSEKGQRLLHIAKLKSMISMVCSEFKKSIFVEFWVSFQDKLAQAESNLTEDKMPLVKSSEGIRKAIIWCVGGKMV